MLAAEHVAAESIELICQQAGELLYDHYLQRKAFPFASEIVSSALTSQLRMAFVSHDAGEMDGEEDWGLEAEPEPAAIDTWASMHLEVRRPVDRARGAQKFRRSTGSVGRVPSQGSSRPASGRRPSPDSAGAFGEDGADSTSVMGRSASSTARKTMRPSPKGAKEERPPSKAEPRARPLPDGVHLDEEEERIREAKRQEELKVRDRERRAREAERQKEEEKQKIMALHEEMDKRPHTFDSEGNLIWIEQPKVDKLPRVCEDFSFHVRASPQGTSGGPMSLGETVKLDAGDARRQKPVKGTRSSQTGHRAREPEQFTDFFSRLQHNQPPVLETMGVAPGVTLESMGKKKMGHPDHSGQRQMSRTEYVSLAERELGLGGAGGAAASQDAPGTGRSGGQGSSRNRSNEAAAPLAATAPPASGRKSSGQAVAPVANPQLGSAPAPALSATAPILPMAQQQLGSAPPPSGPGGGTPQLPPIQQRGSLPAQRGPPPPPGPGAYPRGAMTSAPMPPSIAEGEGEGEAKVLKAPPAPPRRTRSLKSFQALGFQRPPRYHSPELGTQMGVGLAQPPIGATMGHGLVRASSEAAYYFPSPAPSVPGSLVKSGSEGSLQANPRLGGGGAPRRPADQQPPGGRMVAEQTKAYQAFRQTLDPVGVITR